MEKLKSVVESYLEVGRKMDYMNRIFASFAEIYNYLYIDQNLDRLFQNENEVSNLIQDFGKDIKVYRYLTNERDMVQFVSYGFNHESKITDMIGMAVRIIETFSIHDYEVKIYACDNNDKLCNYLDCLDIDYQATKQKDGVMEFEIVTKNEDKTLILAKGTSISNYAYEVTCKLKNLLVVSGDFLKTDDKILDLVVSYQTNMEQEHAMYLVQELRLNGFKTELIKDCDSECIKINYPSKYVIRINENDIQNDEVTLEDLYTGEIETVREMDLINHLDIQF